MNALVEPTAEQITIKTEPTFNIKVENNVDQLEILQEIAIRSGPLIENKEHSNGPQNQIDKLNSEKTDLLSDLLSLTEDYDRVCLKLNEKESECSKLRSVQTAMEEKLDKQNTEIQKLKLKLQKKKEVKSDLCEKKSNVFDVEKIMGHKVVNGEILFLIRWKGYGAEDDTWEKKKNLFCDKFLKNYMSLNNLV